jgi:integrase
MPKPYTDAKGRKRFSVEFAQRGHRVFRRLPPGATKAQALQLEARLRNELIDQDVIGKRPNVPLRNVIEEWFAKTKIGRKSEKPTRSHADAVLELTQDEDLRALGAVADRIRDHPDWSPATKNRRLCVLKGAAKYGWRRGWTEENLSGKLPLLPENNYQRREVTPAMARKLITHASTPRAKALIALSAYTGLRLGEVLKLRAQDVRGGVLVLRDTKNGTDRLIPILKPLKAHLAQIPFGANWRNVYRGFERARERAGLDIRYHDLRHMVGSALTNTGADLRLVGDILGHESLQTTRRYTHPNMDVKRKAMEKALSPITPPIRKSKRPRKAA